MKTRHSLATALFLLTACPQADELDYDEHPAAVPDHAACGGADLMSDDFNCGACGHECPVLWAGTDFAAGGCVEGECGPRWSGAYTIYHPPLTLTCEKLCAATGQECVPDGCSGLTGYVCIEIWDFEGECDLSIPGHLPTVEMTGSCDAAAPSLEDLSEIGYFNRYLNCCCK